MYNYFSIQAKVGISKHPGGLDATKFLIGKCQINETKSILVVGCGNGTSCLKIASLTGCTVVGIDKNYGMLAIASKRETNKVKFSYGDAEKLEFPDDNFDVVLSESVTGFVDKHKALSEYFRVLKTGGFLGLNEVTWADEPSVEVKEYVDDVLAGLDPVNAEQWAKAIERAGFSDIKYEVRKMKGLSQFGEEVRMEGFRIFAVWWNFLKFYSTDQIFRKSVHIFAELATHMPKGLFKSFGYGLYSAKK